MTIWIIAESDRKGSLSDLTDRECIPHFVVYTMRLPQTREHLSK